MKMDHRGLFLGIVFPFCFLVMAKAQNLVARECAAKLPTPRTSTTAIYDGKDSIYLFGGFDGRKGLNETLKYSISLDTLAPAGQLPLQLGSYAGGATLNKHGEIFYIAGSGYTDILQYFPDFQNFTKVGSIPGATSQFATVMPDENTALLLGGIDRPGDVISLDMNTLTSEVIHRLQETAPGATGIWVEGQGAAYVFDGYMDTIQKYTRAANVSELISLSLAMSVGVKAVWDGNFGYVVGEAEFYRDSIMQFDPRTETVAYIQVEDHPGDNMFYATAAVYVETCNRIYLFGGADGRENIRHGQIWYITSNQSCQIQPPVTTTANTS